MIYTLKRGVALRFAVALTSLVLGGLLMLFAIGQATFLSGPKIISYTVQLENDAKLLVISNEQLDEVPGQANIIASGDNPAIGYGNDSDVEAWVAPFEYAEIATESAEESFQLRKVPANTAARDDYLKSIGANQTDDVEPPSVSPSDLWLSQSALSQNDTEQTSDGNEQDESVRGTAKLPVSLKEGQSAIVSFSSSEAEPELQVQWVQDRNLPLVGPFLLAGGILVLFGGLMYLIAVDHDRRGLGPRRGRKGVLLGIRHEFAKKKQQTREKKSETLSEHSTSQPDDAPDESAPDASTQNAQRREFRARRSSITLMVFGIVAALGVSGCSAKYWPQTTEQSVVESEAEQENQPQNLAPVPVTEGQIQQIITDIAELTATADQNLDASALTQRFTGDALKERETNYTIRRSVSDYNVIVPGISDTLLGYQLVQSTETWPRTMLVIVDSITAADTQEPVEGEEKTESPSLALILTQQTPHDNFLVSRSIVLRGNTEMPDAAPAEVGTALLADDLNTLKLAPIEVGAAYAAVLAGGTGVPEAANFLLEGDSLISRSGASWVSQAAAAASSAGQNISYSVSAVQSDAKITSLSTGVGGALVATTVLETRVEEAAAGSNWRPTISSSAAALSGLSGRQNKIVTVVAHQLLFYVPSSDSTEQIELLGFSSDLISASNG